MTDINPEIFTIDTLGHKGDGLVKTPEGVKAIPFTLPGERVQLSTNGELTILDPSPHRAEPPCPHFGVCGGCRLQHLDTDSYAKFKRQQVVGALQQQGFSEDVVHQPILLPSAIRRRVTLRALRTRSQLSLGYFQRNSDRWVVDVSVCPLVVPEIEAFIGPLRNFLQTYLQAGQKLAIWVTQADQGLDICFSSQTSQTLSLDQRMQFTDFAQHTKCARLSVHTPHSEELIVCFQQPTVSFAGYPVTIDAKGFLQASTEADRLLADLVTDELEPQAQRVADLFCGRGTLTLPLAQQCRVEGFESDPAALQALQKTVDRHQQRVQLFERDLFTAPLTVKELEIFDTVVLDPPRSGAFEQVKRLADSTVAKIVMVSCNPATFARDAKALCDGDYRLVKVIPVDQFLWSPHVEVVAVFDKKS